MSEIQQQKNTQGLAPYHTRYKEYPTRTTTSTLFLYGHQKGVMTWELKFSQLAQMYLLIHSAPLVVSLDTNKNTPTHTQDSLRLIRLTFK